MKKLLFILGLLLMFSCNQDSSEEEVYEGNALGTTFYIKFFSDNDFDAQAGIDSVFYRINRSMSTYMKDSDISKINKGDSSIRVDEMFREVFRLSQEINKETNGYFDPTVGNIVNAYGFGAETLELKKDSATIDSLMQYVGLEKVSISKEGEVIKESPHVYLEFNAIAKGYAVDRLGVFLENKGVENYIVEVGGELRARGVNIAKNKDWQVGIDDPNQSLSTRTISTIVRLENKAMATSGNYRKHKTDSVTGEKYVHTINPTTGFPEKSDVLSATILAETCAVADAYATAVMAMGLSKSKETLKRLEGIEALLIYDDNGTIKSYTTTGMEKMIVDE